MTIENLKSQNLILFEAIAGSKAFGLNTPSSDTDIKGVFYLPKEQFYGLDYIPQISNETNDIVYYEIGRFVELLLKNNPNIIELLASPDDCILYKHPLMECFKLEDFLSKLCKDSFAGYAMTQIKKARGLNKKIVNPIAKERKSLLDFCNIVQGIKTTSLNTWLQQHNYKQEQCGLVNIPHAKGVFALFYDKNNNLGYRGIIKNEVSNEVSLSSIPKDEKEIALVAVNQEGYSKYCKEYNEYWQWIEKRNEDRYNTNEKHGKNYDSKNMMHTIRLLQSAAQIMSQGTLNPRVSNREELLQIKAGVMDYDAILQMAHELINQIEYYHDKTSLQSIPNLEKTTQNLIQIRTLLYR